MQLALALLLAVAGGQNAEECGWPDTVAVTGGGGLCTGSLVHPRLVVYAAHCGGGGKTIRFGQDSTVGGISRNTVRCETYPDYMGTSDQAHDWAFCVLEEPVTELPITPPAYGCELDVIEAGTEVVIAGFGDSTTMGGAGTKRWGWTEIVSTLGSTANIGGDGVSTCEGDSGGSAFVLFADGSWRSISMTSTGIGCGKAGVHSLMHPAIPWIEETSGIDITPCHDVDGTWNPTANCQSFFAGSEVGSGTWDNWCEGTAVSGLADSCGAAYDASAEQDPPVVTITSPFDGEEFETGAVVDIVIDAIDDAAGVHEVWIEIDQMEQPVRDELTPFSIDGVPFPDGVYTVVAFAADWDGKIGESEPVTIGINAEVPDDSGGEDESGGATDTDIGDGSDEDAGEEDAGDEEGSDTDDPTAGADGGAGEGCACRSGGDTAWWLPLLVALPFRRRRR